MAELAARLGSIVTFDRRGDVVWMDDFESGVEKWVISGSGTGYGCVSSAEKAKTGGWSAKLTTGQLINYLGQMRHYQSYPALSKIGFEVSFVIHLNLGGIRLELGLYTGTTFYVAMIDICPTPPNLGYYDENFAYQTIAHDISIAAWDYLFHTAKLVANFETGKYTRLIFDNYSYDLSSAKMYSSPSSTSPNLFVTIIATPSVNANESTYIDDVIITQNEP